VGLQFSTSSKATGIACGIGAGALWGLVFLAPELVRNFSPLQLTIGRYLAYGAISFLLILPHWRKLTRTLTPQMWWVLAWLALTGNTLYYILLSSAIHLGGIAMTSLIIGFLPVAVTIIGSRDQGAVPLTRLAPSLLFCAAGAVCIGWQAMANPLAKTIAVQVAGLCCAVGALISWTTYAVSNSRWLSRFNNVSIHDWNLLLGIVTGAQALLLVPVCLALGLGNHSGMAWAQLAGVSVGVALLASLLGNALWNKMSRLLPLTLVGQMILFETLFALLYGFLWEQRFPSVWEATAFVFVALSVISCIAAHRKNAT
jgi:drug/metabolite transporter (DMT)-like permease